MNPLSNLLGALCFFLGILSCHGKFPNVQLSKAVLPEKQTGTITFSFGLIPLVSNGFTCKIMVHPDFALDVVLNPTTVTSPDGLKVSTQITAVDDGKLEGVEDIILHLQCGDFDRTIKQRVVDAPDGISGDPHFVQSVMDMVTNQPERVCYDVSGNAEDNIIIYTNNKVNLTLEGQLMDDYYMHSIHIFSKGCNVEVSQTDVKLNQKSVFHWGHVKNVEIEHNDVCMLRRAGNLVQVHGFSKTLFGGVDFVVKRSSHIVSGHFLDVNIEGIESYENIGGLMGSVGNGKFKFYKSVQTEGNLSKGTVAVNGHFTTATKIQREGLSCWWLNIKDAIRPRPISNFVYAK